MTLLQVENIDSFYGDFQALYGIEVTVQAGETLAIVGANGAGKSTLLKTIAGVMKPKKGRIYLDGKDITDLSPHKRVAEGIALTPEGRKIFPSMSVEENLRIGGYAKRKGPWNLKTVMDAIPLVEDIRGKQGKSLSGGEQQATAIARALMSNPRLLLLDEVSLGLAPIAVEGIYEALPSITSQGTTVLVVEQDLHHALKVSDRIQCLLEGKTALEGQATSFTREQLTKAYFGV